MNLKDKNNLNPQGHSLHLDGDDGLSDLTQKYFKDLEQDRFEYDHDGNFIPEEENLQSVRSNEATKTNLTPQHALNLSMTRANPDRTMQHIDWNYLRTFYYVVKAGSFKRAEKYLYVSQSSISRTIQNLEKSLGKKLFLRATSRRNPTMTLTPIGSIILAQVSQGAKSFETLNNYVYVQQHRNKKNVEISGNYHDIIQIDPGQGKDSLILD